MNARQMSGQFLLLVTVAGCASTAPTPKYLSRVGEEPAVGAVSEARVGEPVYVNFDYRSEEVLRLGEGLERGYPACLACRISIPAGAVLDARSSGSYCTREPYLQALAGENVVCFMLDAPGAQAVRFRVPGTLADWLKLDRPIPIERAEVMVGEGFKSELVYQGVAADVLRLLYREYSESLVRPAFQQELTYTMEAEGPTEVGFRGLRLEVLGADNSGIRYRVVTGL